MFTLADMEKEGILVEAEALKEYGEKLQVRIEALEKKSGAGRRRNLTFPKQLSDFVREIRAAREESKDKQDIPQRPMCWKN